MIGTNDSWGHRVDKIKNLFNFKDIPGYVSVGSVGNQIKNKIQSSFERFWLDQVNEIKIGDDNQDHNKLRFYKSIKGCFKTEPYLDMVHNRNQRSNLTRLRTSAHSLEVELQRYKVPPVPYSERYCRYCTMQVPGNEVHFLYYCETFLNKRQCLLGKLSSINPIIKNLDPTNQIKTMLCPATLKATTLVNKYISIMLKARTNIDNGEHVSNLTFPPHVNNYTCTESSLDDSIASVSTSSSLPSLSDHDDSD